MTQTVNTDPSSASSNSIEHQCDVLIIGSGAAGLSLALKLADSCNVIVLSKSVRTEGATRYAQGGIAAVFDETDSIDSHVQDTLNAGAGLCDEEVARFTAERGKSCMEWLINFGMPFDTETTGNGETRYHLTREGGHSHRRILHSADATGQAVQVTLTEAVNQHPNIHLFERYNAIDLIQSKTDRKRCIGAYVWSRNQEHVEVIRCRFATSHGGREPQLIIFSS